MSSGFVDCTTTRRIGERDIYEYRATVAAPADVHDGDTIRVTVDQGFYHYTRMSIRLLGINAPELSTAAGKLARAHLVSLIWPSPSTIRPPATLVLRSHKDAADKYGGRWDGTLWVESDGLWTPDNRYAVQVPSLNQRMVADGFAVARTY